MYLCALCGVASAAGIRLFLLRISCGVQFGAEGWRCWGPGVTCRLEPLSFSRPLIQFYVGVARPCKDSIQVQPLLEINKARNILLRGIRPAASAGPAAPTPPTAGALSAFLPGRCSRTQRGAATLARPLASASGIAATSRIAAALATRRGRMRVSKGVRREGVPRGVRLHASLPSGRRTVRGSTANFGESLPVWGRSLCGRAPGIPCVRGE